MKNNWLKVALPHFVAALILLLIAVIYCKPVLSGKVLSQSDNIQWQATAKESLDYKAKHGVTPLWTTSMFGGMPTYQLSAESPYGQLSWIQPLFSLGLPKPMAYFFVAGLAFYLLCSVLGASPWVALLGAIGYAYSSYDPIIIATGHDSKMLALSYLPAVVAGLMLILQKKYFLGAGIMALFLCYFIAANHLQVTYYFFLVLGVICLSFAVYTILAKQYKHLFISAALVVISVGFAIGSNAMLLWTTYEYSKASNRGGASELTPVATPDASGAPVAKNDPRDKDYAFNWSYGVFETFTFFVPNVNGGASGGELSTGSNTYTALKAMGYPDAQAEQTLPRIPTYWGDQPFTSGPVYLGIIICMLAIMGWFLVTTWHKWWLLAVTVFGILLSWGSNFKVFNYFLFDHLPFYDKFRAPSQALVIPQLAVAIMAGLGLQALIAAKPSPELWKKLKLSLYVTGGILGFLLLASFMVSYSSTNDAQLAQQAGEDLMRAIVKDRQSLFRGDVLRSIVFAALAAALIYFYYKGKLKLNYLLGGLVVLTLVDLIGVDLRYLNNKNYQDAATYSNNFPESPADQEILKDTDPYYRVLNLTVDPYTDAFTSYYHHSVGGYHPAKLQLYVDLIDRQLRKNNIRVLNMLNTKYVIIPGGQQQNPNQPAPPPVAQRNPEALGNAWFVQNIQWADNADAEMKALDSLDTRHSVVIDKRYKADVTNGPATVADSTASIHLVSNDLNSISYESNAGANQYAVFSEIYYKAGWSAFLDGKQVPYSRVNYLLRGMSVPAGKHKIEFKFEPHSYYTGSKISIFSYAATLIVVILGLVLGYRASKKPVLKTV